MENSTFVNVTEGKTKREDLYLPRLYFPAVDPYMENSWLNVLGAKTFCSWLQLITLVDRNEDAMSKYGNKDTVPRSLEGLAKLLDMSKPTFYKQVVKPLWNYGFIDLVEWKEQKKLGTKAINIIVYPYPQNNRELEGKPLVKVRDYDTEYNSNAKTFGQMGAQLRKKDSENRENESVDLSNRKENLTVEGKENENVENVDLSNRKENLTVENVDLSNRKENLTVEGKENLTEGVKKTLPINNTNTINNSNTIINNTNTINKDLKEKKEEEEENNIIYMTPKGESDFNKFEIYRNEKMEYKAMIEMLLLNDVKHSLIIDIINELEKVDLTFVSISDAQHQLLDMLLKIQNGEPIYDFAKYFVIGLQRRSQNSSLAKLHNVPSVSQDSETTSKPVFYNWLEERN